MNTQNIQVSNNIATYICIYVWNEQCIFYMCDGVKNVFSTCDGMNNVFSMCDGMNNVFLAQQWVQTEHFS